jgi:hypothetical protein
LAEIQRSKATYCHFTAPEYMVYDAVVTNTEMLTPEFLAATLHTKLARLAKAQIISVEPVTTHDVVFRVMSDTHLPEEADEKRRKKASTGGWIPKTNFPPFQHYVLHGDVLVEVGRSHWQDDLETGQFCASHGKITNRLATMFLLLVDQYSRRGNWRGYSYVSDMRGQALVQLSQVGLQFDESRSDNPFAWYTQIIKNCLAGDTLILTREYGSVPIEQVAEQDVTLLDGNGEWVTCHIYDYGVQETVNLNFYGNYSQVSVRSTMEHEWIEQGTKEKITTRSFVEHPYRQRELRIDDLRPSKIVKDDEEYRRGVIHGLIYGDGTACHTPYSFTMRVCNGKSCLEQWLDGYSKTYPPSTNGDPVYHLNGMKDDLKSLPETPGASLDYLLGFFRGWLATDGCVSTDGDATICGDQTEYEWIKQWAPLIGWHANSFTLLNEVTNFGTRNKKSGNVHLKKQSMDASDYLRIKHRDRFHDSHRVSKWWRVYPGKQQSYERRMEKVYCPSVPTTQSFALASGIQSANCFRRILLLEKRNQDIRDDLLIMAGAMPSYTRQVEAEMDQHVVVSPVHVAQSPAIAGEPVVKEAKRRGRKPKVPLDP